jgi:hypothetical protein
MPLQKPAFPGSFREASDVERTIASTGEAMSQKTLRKSSPGRAPRNKNLNANRKSPCIDTVNLEDRFDWLNPTLPPDAPTRDRYKARWMETPLGQAGEPQRRKMQVEIRRRFPLMAHHYAALISKIDTMLQAKPDMGLFSCGELLCEVHNLAMPLMDEIVALVMALGRHTAKPAEVPLQVFVI